MGCCWNWTRCKHIFCFCCYSKYHNRYKMRTQTFGKMSFAQAVHMFEIENKHGAVLTVIDYGARIVGLKVPAANDTFVDVVCGFKSLEDYLKDDLYFGALVGRVAGRTAPATVNIDGRTCNLVANDGNNHLHGGLNGFDKVVWRAEPIEEENGVSGIRFRHNSPSGTEGYPGELVCEVEYRLTNENEVIIKIKCLAEEATIVSIPNHAYFNLGGKDEPNIYEHIVSIAAESYLPVNENSIPTGEIVPVQGTIYDFRKGRRLGDAIPTTPDNGYDHYFCLSDVPRTTPAHAATISHPKTGISMEILTTQPGVLMYTGNYLHKDVVGKYGEILDRHSAICFETQNYPNAINTPGFPSPIVKSGQTYLHTTIWKFTKSKHKD
ncbi:galactose mutarotase-like [Paramacrobiotus metropolitanus]|uniref:galactose mutarotase-like n=1 Tax=Paramacrobiotus metropolitanus TaxID=2943436 RepID=UPI002446594A|nr:galactose mutarotase-like [Paramacrobiotus metropolitanus]XP_055337566.1 galactose mutarotase-like [Paramacrobiotus metropolitanus]XP_055337567.1 galactose mutarotase-like [Paramacrobiotus metropolitanus]XP_055337568.1 galactose mutarotase-like [Paramacrobiotus metropolitanus]